MNAMESGLLSSSAYPPIIPLEAITDLNASFLRDIRAPGRKRLRSDDSVGDSEKSALEVTPLLRAKTPCEMAPIFAPNFGR